ncbi:succinate dehydrogenase cytochrome b subunit [Pseudopedobacter beijingensis]|uniref:Succinate dehydrogenase cytochrome b subunit n=1 Tax=Pseudopedobacter beijingensis TaxID=1207056 RepID=A0ABW4IEK5_9SPHI
MLTTLSRKMIMGLTGLFLCFFLTIHLLGNLQLFLPAEEARIQFNWYSHLLSGNALIKLVSYILYLSIIIHVVDSIIITSKNKKASTPYQYDKRKRASKWYSRNMGILGTIILIFLVIHFKNFWYVYKFGEMPLDEQGQKDLYQIVVTTFQEGWYVVIYVIAMIALCYHLLHGISSAFRSFGLYHPKYVRWVKYIGYAFSIIVCTGFALMPIYIFFTMK